MQISGFPEQFGLLTPGNRLTVGMFVEVGVGLVGDAGVGFWHRPNGPGWTEKSRVANRVQKTLEDAHTKLAAVARDVRGVPAGDAR